MTEEKKKPYTTDRQIRAHSLPPGSSKNRHAVLNKRYGYGGLAIEARQDRSALTWVYRYRIAGKSREMTLGTYPPMSLQAACQAHAEAAGMVAKGLDPMKQRKAEKATNEQKWTMADLFELWIDHYATTPSPKRGTVPTPATVKKQRGRWDLHLSRDLADLYVRDVSRGILVAVLEKAVKSSREEARQCLSILRMMLDYAETREQIDGNPADQLKPHKVGANPSKPRDRYLTMTEITELWLLLDDVGKLSLSIGNAIKLLILTGSRRGEVAGMEWKEISGNTWTIPAARTKSRRAHDVHLSAPAMAVIESQREISGGGPFVFESPKKTSDGNTSPHPISRDAITRALARLQGRGTTKHDTKAPLYHLEPFTVHDLRRSVATGCTEALGADPLLVDTMLDHLPPKLLGTYNKAKRYPAQIAVWNRWGELIDSTVSRTNHDSNVIPMAKG